jgi:hypothetical protein
MKVYTYVFGRDSNGNISGSHSVREDGHAVLDGGMEIVPWLVLKGDLLRVPPQAKKIVQEVIVEERQ